MNEFDEKLGFYAHALVLGLVDIKEMNEWLFEVIEQKDLGDIPEDFFELIHYDQKQMLNYISEQRLTQVKSLKEGRDLLKYYLNKNQLVSSQCLLDDRHLEKLFNIVNLFDLHQVYEYLSFLYDDGYIDYVYPDKNTTDFIKFLDNTWLEILNQSTSSH